MRQLLVGLGITLLVAVAATLLLDAPWWAMTIMGAVLSLSLWVMLWIGDSVRLGRLHTRVSPEVFAVSGAIAAVFGIVLAAMAGTAGFVPVGFVMAGGLVPSAASLTKRDAARES